MMSLPLGFLCVLWRPEIASAFHPSARAARRGRTATPTTCRGQTTSATIARLWPLTVNSAPKIIESSPTKTEQEELIEYELAEEDFLLAKVKPKVLNHGTYVLLYYSIIIQLCDNADDVCILS